MTACIGDRSTDVLVVDLSRALAGPHATMMLGDLGARVIKVEAPGHGDDTRGWGPPFVGDPEDDRQSTYFLSANRNKESITLDLKDEADRDVLLQLVDRADVLVENFRTGVLERLGLGIESLQRAQPAAGGALDHRLRPRRARGRPRRLRPDRPGRGRADVADRLRARGPAAGRRADRRPAGRHVRRLRRARRAPRAATAPASGTVVRTSLLAAVVGVHAFQGTRWTVAGEVGRAQGNHHPSIAPYGLFHCRDGVGADRGRQRGAVAAVLRGLRPRPDADGAGHQPRAGRPTGERVIEVVEEAFADWDAEPLLARLAEVGVPAGKVRTIDEVYALGPDREPGPAGRRRAPDARAG